MRRTLVAAVAAVTACGVPMPASAQSGVTPQVAIGYDALYGTPGGLLVRVPAANGAPAIKIFEMTTGACLRGPLAFYDGQGRVIFQLADNVEYPGNCSDNR